MDPQYRSKDKMADDRSFRPNSNRGSQYSSEPAYFKGQNKEDGYPFDVKGKQPYEVNERSVQSTPMDTPRDSIDMEKQNGENSAIFHDTHIKDPNQPKIPFGQRIKHFTWAW
jgi:hypothetical protein